MVRTSFCTDPVCGFAIRSNQAKPNDGACPLCASPIQTPAIGTQALSARLANHAAKMDQKQVEEIIDRKGEFEDRLAKKKGLAKVTRYMHAMFEVLVDPKTGWASKVTVAAALAYVFSPIDLIPDIIPGIGFLDDVAVVLLAVAAVRSDINRALARIDEKERRARTAPVVVYTVSDGRHDLDGTTDRTPNWIYCFRTIASLEAQGLTFGEPPLPNRVYLQHPIVRTRLVPLEGFQERMLAEKWRECWRIFVEPQRFMKPRTRPQRDRRAHPWRGVTPLSSTWNGRRPSRQAA